jgi:glycosyltransferase involved in cell wall biosynthesis
MPRVSIIIPTYNGDRFIAETLESVLNQTYDNYEIIVIDDGSSDTTLQVLNHSLAQYGELGGDRIRIVTQANQGVAAARNRGLELAQGELIIFLDQDDLLLPDKLATQVPYFDRFSDVGIVHSGWRLVDAQGNKLSDSEPWRDVPVLNSASWIRRMPALFSAMIFRRDWLERVNGLSTQFKQACDVDLIQRLVLAGCQSVWLPQITVLYRQHDRNDSLNTLVQAEECWLVLEQFFRRSDIPPKIRKVERERKYYTAVWIAWRLYYTGELARSMEHLEKSLSYTPFDKTETILHWINSFADYSESYGREADLAFSDSIEWEILVQSVLSGSMRG